MIIAKFLQVQSVLHDYVVITSLSSWTVTDAGLYLL